MMTEVLAVGRSLLCLSAIPLFGLSYSLYQRLSRYSFSRARGCRAARSKAPLRDPFIGLDFIYDILFGKGQDKYLESSRQAFQELGTTYLVDRWSWKCVYTCDSRNIKHLLVGGFGDFDLPRLRVSAMEAMLGQGIFSLNGPSWSSLRQALKPFFAKQVDKEAIVDSLEGHFQTMLGLLPDNDDGAPVDLQSLYFGLTMDFAADFMMGSPSRILAGRDPAAARQFVDDYMTCSTEVVKKMGLGPLQRLRFSFDALWARKRLLGYIDNFIDECLERRRWGRKKEEVDEREEAEEEKESSPGHGFLLDCLMAISRSRKDLRDQVLHMLVASRDTTASVLSNLFFVLARNPDIYARLREQVLAVAGHEAPTAGQLKRMEYARWCINESLRLHPVIPTNAREAARDTTIPYGGGPDGSAPLLVKKGMLVMYNLYAMHRREDIFGDDAAAFVPERWETLRPGWNYLPFNGGPRICMGQQLALLEAQYVVARMAQTFASIEGHGDKDWVEHYALATSCRNGVHVSLRRAR